MFFSIIVIAIKFCYFKLVNITFSFVQTMISRVEIINSMKYYQ